MAAAVHHQQSTQLQNYRMPLVSLPKWKPSDQLNTDTELPSVLIISLDTKPQEPEAGCQYSAFSPSFTPPLTVLQNLSSSTMALHMTMH